MSEQLKYILISAFITSLNMLAGISLNGANASLVIQIGLTIFAISVCLIYVYQFSKSYRSKTSYDKIQVKSLLQGVQPEPHQPQQLTKEGFHQPRVANDASADNKHSHA